MNLPRSRALNGIAYHRAGKGIPVVLVHGVGLRAESWYPQIGALQAANAVYAVDMPGHGESARLDCGTPTLTHFTDRIAEFIEAIVAEPVVVVGHSMGAMVALDCAFRFPHLCKGVGALNAVYRRTPEARQAIQARANSLRSSAGQDIAAAPIKRWFGDNPNGHNRDMAQLCRKWLVETDRRGYAAAYSVFAAEDGPSDTALAALAMPALFLTGEYDLNSPPEMARAMAGLVPHSKVTIVDKAGHLVQLTHSIEVNRALCAFVAGCVASGAVLQPTGTGGN